MATAKDLGAGDLFFRRPVKATIQPAGHPLPFELEAARRALKETQEALSSQEIADAGTKAADDFAASLSSKPEKAEAGEVVGRVVAIGARREGVPAVPLEGIAVRLRIGEREVAEGTTDRVGLVRLPLGDITGTRYEMEVLATDCSVLLCQHGRIDDKGATSPHLLELPRTETLKPHLERAQPFENAIREAHTRAKLGAEVATKALKAQEKALREFLDQREDRGANDKPADAPNDKPEGDAPADTPGGKPGDRSGDKPRGDAASSPDQPARKTTPSTKRTSRATTSRKSRGRSKS